MSAKVEFKGWDWTELFQLFPELDAEFERSNNADLPAYPEPGNWIDTEAELGQKLALAIVGVSDEETIAQLRTFLDKVASASGYYEPYFRGILAIENNEVFVQVYSWHVTCMWT